MNCPSLIRWVGAKKTAARRLLRHFPRHEKFVSPFGGSGGEFLVKPRSRIEVHNDLHPILSRLFERIRNRHFRERLKQLLQESGSAKRTHREAMELLKSSADEDTRCMAFVVATHLGWHGLDPLLRSYGVNRPGLLRRRADSIEPFAERFKYIRIERRDWSECVTDHDGKGAFFFVDPPYLTGQAHKEYRLKFGPELHQKLLGRLMFVKGKVMLCGYWSALYEQYLAGWRRIEIPLRITMTKETMVKNEVFWMNY